TEHDEDESKQIPGDDRQDFHRFFSVFVFELAKLEVSEKFLCFLRSLLFIRQLRSNKRTCDGFVALSSSELSSLTAAASPPLNFFPFSDTSPSATWTQAWRPGARWCVTRLLASSLASQRSASW